MFLEIIAHPRSTGTVVVHFVKIFIPLVPMLQGYNWFFQTVDTIAL